jgi:hypothetical protein
MLSLRNQPEKKESSRLAVSLPWFRESDIDSGYLWQIPLSLPDCFLSLLKRIEIQAHVGIVSLQCDADYKQSGMFSRTGFP